jgi:hypothetical protein
LILFPAKNESAGAPRNSTGFGAIDQVRRSTIGAAPRKRFVVRLKSKQSNAVSEDSFPASDSPAH